MKSINLKLSILAVLIIISLFWDLSVSVWIGLALVIGILSNKLVRIGSSDLMIQFLFISSILIAIFLGILLYIKFGWLSAMIYGILFLAYFGLNNPYEKIERSSSEMRSLLLDCVRQWTTNQATLEQLETRFHLILKDKIRSEMLNWDRIIEIIISKGKASDTEYEVYLKLLEKNIPRLDRHYLYLLEKNDPQLHSRYFEYKTWKLYNIIQNQLAKI